jgi:hypothetical protein
MRPVVVTVTGIDVSPVIIPDHYTSPATMALGVKISATATYKVEHTYDDVFSPTFDPGTAIWYNHPTLGPALTANADGNYAYPPRGFRLNVAASTGTVTLTVNQAGLT